VQEGIYGKINLYFCAIGLYLFLKTRELESVWGSAQSTPQTAYSNTVESLLQRVQSHVVGAAKSQWVDAEEEIEWPICL